uniref:protein-tyrosine-phosphatase n=1 Tax=Ganoderma lucidum TaxID=5315 RepID=A0A514YQR1_GANLU|nr:tyrosine protein phosphatase PTP3 [Ganoderma lucidum]
MHLSSSSSVRPSSPTTAYSNIPTLTSGLPEDSLDGFAAAISARYARQATSLISLNSPSVSTPQSPASPPHPSQRSPGPIPPLMTSSLSLPPMPSSSTLGSSSSVLPPTAFISLSPSSLPTVLSDESALILDIRPHNSYFQARVPNALCLSVPSTLLKRPNFPLARLAEMLPTSAARDKFARWPHASRILVYDADSAALPPTSNLLGLMRKFRNEGFPDTREIAWLRSGFHAVWREHPSLVEHGPPPDAFDEDDATGEPETDGDPAPLGRMASNSATTRVLRAKHLPKDAFTTASTVPFKPRGVLPGNNPLKLVPPTPSMSRECLSSSAALPLATSVVTVPPPLATASLSGPPVPGKAKRAQFNLRLPPGLVQHGTAGGAPLMSIPNGALFSAPTLSPPYSHPGSYENPSFSLPGRPVAFNPFFDTIRQNIELGSRDSKTTHSEGIPLKLSRRVCRRVGELPFEWLRQIARKSRQVGADSSDLGSDSDGADGDESISEGPSTSKAISEGNVPPPRPSHVKVTSTARRSPQRSPFSSPSQPLPVPSSSSPHPGPLSPTSSVDSPSPPGADDLTRLLESQFYRIELGEQKRLLGVMERHSMESGKVIHEAPGVRGFVGIVPPGHGKSVPGSAGSGSSSSAGAVEPEPASPFPFSITAGLEKGAKNRYRNIWPFEHARVRLRKAKPDDDDYMNASYVQPLGTTKRYIATQGPLPTTFTDFWTLCWEQNVHVIVMLTREIEGSSVKCGKYWEDGTYGTLRLKLVETNDTPERERKRRESETSGGFFSQHIPHATKSGSRGRDPEAESTIKRVFELSNVAYPHAPPRIVTQFQYLGWPDLNVPDDPHGILNLMRQVEDAAELSRRADQKPWEEAAFHRRTTSQGSPPPLHGNTVVASKGRCIDEVDPVTGVATIARDNAPLLLHCSAGVGRTGGFIAVDAILDGVRREMRKRKAGVERDTADARAASEFGQGRCGSAPLRERSRSNSNSQPRSRSLSVMSTTLESEAEAEPMEVDQDPPAGEGSEKAPLTMPVSVGDQEVHVPVAGFTEPVPMEVDGHPDQEKVPTSPTPSTSLKRSALPPPLLQASPALVEEVRRATLNHDKWTSMSPTTPSTAKGEGGETFDQRFARRLPPSETSSDSFPARSRSGSSRTRKRTRSRSESRDTASASPPTSHADSSTSLMVGKTAELSVTSPSPPLLSEEASDAGQRLTSSSSSEQHVNVSAGAGAPIRPSLTAQSHRLNTWRSEVHCSSDVVEQPPAVAVAVEQKVDTPYPILKEPRKLHGDASPPLLSSYDEPIRRVVEDMREQRMSLCQSLRQYVFVHRAIIEGALMIVDEEKRREAEERLAHADGLVGSELPRKRRSSAPDSTSEGEGDEEQGERTELEIDTAHLGVGLGTRAKRGASPTELTKEAIDGGVLLTKRPSLKKHGRQKMGEFEPLVGEASMMSL